MATLDFSFTDDQHALRDLVDRILGDFATQDRLSALEREPEWFDGDAWVALGRAGVLGVGLPESVGGGGGSFLETAVVLESVGRHVAMVPLLTSIVGGAMPIVRYGDDAQRARWATRAATGEAILTAALQEPQNDDPVAPLTTADLGIDGWRVSGTKHCVPAAHLAARLLVSARAGVGVGLFLVDPAGPRVDLARFTATNGEPQYTVVLDGAEAEPLGDPAAGADIVRSVVEHMTAGLCLIQTGVSERALRMTAEHAVTREQFGQPIAQFQAVSQRAADAFIDTEAIRLTAWQAAWRLAEGIPAADEVAIAKFWAADGGRRVALASQHLHGGVGVDVDYPLRRYYTWAKVDELSFGSATRQLRSLGAHIAAT